MSRVVLIFFTAVFTTFAYAAHDVELSTLHPNMTGQHIQADGFSIDNYVVELSSADTAQTMARYQQYLSSERQQNKIEETVVAWIHAPFNTRAPNADDESNLDLEAVANSTSKGIPGSTVDRVDFFDQPDVKANTNFWGRFKNIAGINKQKIYASFSKVGFKWIRTGVTTWKQYHVLILSYAPIVAAEHSALIFAWCGLHAFTAHQANNFTYYRTFTANDDKAKLYRYIPKSNEERSLVTAVQNLFNSTAPAGQTFRYLIRQVIFVSGAFGLKALVNYSHGLSMISEPTLTQFFVKMSVGILLSTVFQLRSETANVRFREWAARAGLSENQITFFSQGGFAIASILSVNGALLMGTDQWLKGLAYFFVLGGVSQGAVRYFEAKEKLLGAGAALQASQCDAITKGDPEAIQELLDNAG